MTKKFCFDDVSSSFLTVHDFLVFEVSSFLSFDDRASLVCTSKKVNLRYRFYTLADLVQRKIPSKPVCDFYNKNGASIATCIKFFGQRVLEKAIQRECVFCNETYNGGLSLEYRVFAHLKCINENTISRKEMFKHPLFHFYPLGIPERLRYGQLLDTKNPCVLEENTWKGVIKSTEFFKKYFSEIILVSLRKQLFIDQINETDLELDLTQETLNISCECVFHSDAKLHAIQDDVVQIIKIWDKYQFETRELGSFLTEHYVYENNFEFDEAFISYLKEIGYNESFARNVYPSLIHQNERTLAQHIDYVELQLKIQRICIDCCVLEWDVMNDEMKCRECFDNNY